MNLFYCLSPSGCCFFHRINQHTNQPMAPPASTPKTICFKANAPQNASSKSAPGLAVNTARTGKYRGQGNAVVQSGFPYSKLKEGK